MSISDALIEIAKALNSASVKSGIDINAITTFLTGFVGVCTGGIISYITAKKMFERTVKQQKESENRHEKARLYQEILNYITERNNFFSEKNVNAIKTLRETTAESRKLTPGEFEKVTGISLPKIHAIIKEGEQSNDRIDKFINEKRAALWLYSSSNIKDLLTEYTKIKLEEINPDQLEIFTINTKNLLKKVIAQMKLELEIESEPIGKKPLKTRRRLHLPPSPAETSQTTRPGSR